MGENALHLAERVATFAGVTYSARGAITSPDDYEQTKSYIRTAFRTQMANAGASFVEVLCACFAQAYESPGDTLKWIHEKVVAELPLLEFKNAGQMKQTNECSTARSLVLQIVVHDLGRKTRVLSLYKR